MAQPPINPSIAELDQSYALVYAPKRHRQRFPENTVQCVESLDAALAGADAARHLHPARVCGPFRSSEGFRLFYLMHWLD